MCVGVEKSHSFRNALTQPLRHSWADDTLEKLLRICIFGGELVDGLRGAGQDIFWFTDDDAIVATDDAKADAADLMTAMLHADPDEKPMLKLGIASLFDDGLRVEDLLAIPDLAAGAFSESLTETGKTNIPKFVVGPSGHDVFLQIRSTLIGAWRSEDQGTLRQFDMLVRVAEDGRTLFSFGRPYVQIPQGMEAPPPQPQLNKKWRRALMEAVSRRVASRGGDQPV